MGREIRVTIDDDEVFERMKARKRELDLSWEEVLHRGLRREESPDEGAGRRERAAREREGRGRRRQRRARDDGRRHGSHSAGAADPSSPADPLNDPGQFADDLKRQIRGQVLESLQSSLGAEEDPLESEMSSLEAAEDAVLAFDFLGEAASEEANQVPLRVVLEASTDGLAIDVVAVRQGKSVAGMNAFDPAVRRQVIEGLATGETATLRIEAGEESYQVAPSLSWSRTNGTPTVTEVAIEEVQFDVA